MSNPKKILYVHHGSGEGGAANSLLTLLQSIDRTQYNPIISCNFTAPKSESFFTNGGFTPINLPVAPFVHTSLSWRLTTLRGCAKLAQWYFLKRANAERHFRQLLLNQKPQLVHLNGLSILPLSPIARELGIPVILHVRESVNDGLFGARKAWLTHLANEYTDFVIYICNDGRERLSVSTDSSSVIYNPIDFKKFCARSNPCTRGKLGLPENKTVLLFPGGSLFGIKGIMPFIAALNRIREKHIDVCAIIPGLDQAPHPRDSMRAQIESLIKKLNLQDAIIRLPFTSLIEEYYAACDIVVAPFISPHFSRAVIEAGAMAKPVVGSRIGGIQEVLEDGVVGLLATPGDHTDLAEKICTLIDERDRATEMGQAGLRIARQMYDALDHAPAIMAIYDRVLSKGMQSK